MPPRVLASGPKPCRGQLEWLGDDLLFNTCTVVEDISTGSAIPTSVNVDLCSTVITIA